MLTKKSRMTSLVAIAATVMLALSTNVANAASMSGYRACTNNQVGYINAYVAGSGNVRAPGDGWSNPRYFYSPKPIWVDRNQRGQRGGSWGVFASVGIHGVYTSCLNGNF